MDCNPSNWMVQFVFSFYSKNKLHSTFYRHLCTNISRQLPCLGVTFWDHIKQIPYSIVCLEFSPMPLDRIHPHNQNLKSDCRIEYIWSLKKSDVAIVNAEKGSDSSCQSKFFLKMFKQWPCKIFGKDISSLILSVHLLIFVSFSGSFLLNPEMSNVNVLCSRDAFDWAP